MGDGLPPAPPRHRWFHVSTGLIFLSPPDWIFAIIGSMKRRLGVCPSNGSDCVTGAVSPDARRGDAGDARASSRSQNKADGRTPPVTRREHVGCGRSLCRSSSPMLPHRLDDALHRLLLSSRPLLASPMLATATHYSDRLLVSSIFFLGFRDPVRVKGVKP